MAKTADQPESNHLRAWREFRRLSQEKLAEEVGTTKGVISLLESGQRKLSPKWLRRLAPALHTTAGYLLEYDPNELPTAILDVWADIPDERKEQALRVLETFRKAS
jgi:transcriptional regulator with XRE-family HTH domain